ALIDGNDIAHRPRERDLEREVLRPPRPEKRVYVLVLDEPVELVPIPIRIDVLHREARLECLREPDAAEELPALAPAGRDLSPAAERDRRMPDIDPPLEDRDPAEVEHGDPRRRAPGVEREPKKPRGRRRELMEDDAIVGRRVAVDLRP